MDVLKYKTIIGSIGGSSIGSQGLSLAQIICVSRQGEQKDNISFVLLNSITGSQWYYHPVTKRIHFSPEFPFETTETIHIMYKVTL